MDSTETRNTIIRYKKVDSTNRIALELANRNAAHGTVIVAEEQWGGRGRKSREFISPPGGLYVSAILRTNLPPSRLSFITLASAVACAEVVEQFVDFPVMIKWPNDIYGQDRKLGGILSEAGPFSHVDGTIPFVVVGIGLNVNTPSKSFPLPLQNLVASLYSLTQKKYDLTAMLDLLHNELLSAVAELEVQPEDILARWRERDYLINRKLCWKEPDGNIREGVGGGLMQDGRYRLRAVDGKVYSVLAGDITISQKST